MDSSHHIYNQAEALTEKLISWRRELHQHPELSFQEKHTSAFIAEKLEEIKGMTVLKGKENTGVETGVVGILKRGDGSVTALRADIDALPITEENDHQYVSENEGVMHACGHDAHAAMLLGAAHLAAENIENINGTIKFIFQPAEEDTDRTGTTGASYMLENGIYEDVEHAYALHIDPEHPLGSVRLHEGASMASVDTFEAVIEGTGGHGAYPHLGTDPTWMLSFLLQAVQGVSSRRISPLEPAVISIGEIKSGSSYNVIPDKVYIRGTMRSYYEDTRSRIEEELKRAFAIIDSLGGTYTLSIHRGEPALMNDRKVVDLLTETVTEMFPRMTILKEPYGLGGEDFAHVAKVVPAAMMFIGAGIPGRSNSGLHMPLFDFEEAVLPVGAAILANAALRHSRETNT
ncbi:amidohydrolase [Sinobaca qinghaiensis]|uniref:Amidohydrolase n=1 Tax=Sinobaca qinghaiensis TaxID=342944 RepID=A0A419V2N0_9BACL|nr:amidohydrolase [Sinobaca qinghaiensis]RKD72783.1 amidohydrolase [Sinobaca qinghaiensis]